MKTQLQNTFKQDDRRKDCVEFNNPNIWMRTSIEHPKNELAGDRASGIALIVALAIVLGLLSYIVRQYPKAYPPQSITLDK